MRKKLTEQIADNIIEDINQGRYAKGTFLPTEHQLCDIMDASRGTIRTSLRLVEESGLIRVCPGKGSFVVGPVTSQRRLQRFLTGPTMEISLKATEAMYLLSGICRGAAANHAEAIVAFDEVQKPERVISRFSSGNIDGVVFIECQDFDKYIAPLIKANIPCVVANLEESFPVVSTSVDFRNVGRITARHLLDQGHRQIGVLAGFLYKHLYKEMLAGFRGALAEEEIYLDSSLVLEHDTWDATSSYQTSLKLLSGNKRPTAIFAMRDIRAVGFYQACDQLGLKIPEDVSLVSYDDLTWSQAQVHGLSTVIEPAEEMGYAAVELLSEWIVSGVKPDSKVFPGELLERKSVQRI